jgi:hypothetical protein
MQKLMIFAVRAAAKTIFVLCLVALLGVAVISMDSNFIQGVDSADFDARLDKAEANAGYTQGCWITGLPVAGLDPYESWMYSFGFFGRLAQHGYKFTVNEVPQQVVLPWQFGEEIQHCSPFVPKRHLPGEVDL